MFVSLKLDYVTCFDTDPYVLETKFRAFITKSTRGRSNTENSRSTYVKLTNVMNYSWVANATESKTQNVGEMDFSFWILFFM